jgi:hypothetical protein
MRRQRRQMIAETTSNEKLLRGGLKNEGWKGRRVEGEKFKKEIEGFDTLFVNKFQILYYMRNFTAFSDASVHLKKPSGGPKGLIGSPCHGAPWPGRRRQE